MKPKYRKKRNQKNQKKGKKPKKKSGKSAEKKKTEQSVEKKEEDASASCIFCKIVSKSIPSYQVYETEKVVAFLDAFPITEGHVLVCPKQHYQTLDQIPVELSSELFAAILHVAKRIEKLKGVSGYNLLQNNHSSAGQVVPHAHFHLIPRKEEDGLLRLASSSKSMIEKEQAEKLVSILKGKGE